MDIGQIQTVDIEEQMRSAYLDYAMSVIVARALPDARDGLKPVHRRILYAMHDMGIRSNTPYKKSARVVGEVLGKYHPHGDQAVYDTMARMAQDFSMRYMLVDGQGNFGSIDGDPPAAMRYTEARLAKLAEELLADIEKDTVEWHDNFDGSQQEPDVLPARVPNLLLNGTSGIAVGMATNVPPHNLRELANAICYLIDRSEIVKIVNEHGKLSPSILAEQFGIQPNQAARVTQALLANREAAEIVVNLEGLPTSEGDSAPDEATVDELMAFIQGPDFPTGGMIMGTEGIKHSYAGGRGRIVVRGIATIDDTSNRARIIITEIPYQVNKSNLVERIADLVREGKIDAISDMRDESDRNGMRIVIELKRNSQPKKVLNQLYKHTALQSTFSSQVLALVNGEPRLLSLRRALQIYIQHRLDVIRRRSEFELRKAQARAHILEGLLIAVANIDAVIRIIRESESADVARTRLMEAFKLSEIQAQAILDLQLRRLAALERLKIEQEYQEVMMRITYLEDLLAHEVKMLALIKDDLRQLSETFGDNRRTRISLDASSELDVEDLIADQINLVSLTQRGYIKRMPPNTFRAQGRGGKGVIGQNLRDEDEVLHMLSAGSLQTLLFFTDKGKVYSQKAYEIPEASRTDKGISIQNIIQLEAGERVTAILPVGEFGENDFCTMVTREGVIKRVSLNEFESVRNSGLIAISLKEDDILGWVLHTKARQEIIIVTEQGQALRYSTELVRAMGRSAQGVIAMNLDGGDFITGVVPVRPNAQLLVVTANGFGKRTQMDEYAPKGRGTAGIATIAKKNLAETGLIVAVNAVEMGDDITILSNRGQALRTKVSQIPELGRSTKGSRLMTPRDGDFVAAVALFSEADMRGTDAGEAAPV